MTSIKLSIKTIFLLLGVLAPRLIFAQVSSQEERLKAAFVYQFTNYVEWPKSVFKTPQDPFVIEVVGKSPLVEELQKLAQTKKVAGHPITIMVTDEGHMSPAQMVILSGGDEAVLAKIAAKLKSSPCLLVTQGADFAKKGAMINFFVDQERLRFEINRAAVEAAHLHVGSQLLSLAKLVE
jgi:hypothetical protein